MLKKLTKLQMRLFFIPFFGAIAFAFSIWLSDAKRYYTTCILPSLAAALTVFLIGVVLGIIGILSYAVTLIISMVLMGIVYNYIFFRVYNKKSDAEKQ